ncbi:hypothetical protein RB195_024330 [Necator americanus]|uniref:Uncharacterized protein n=1 Tax=Necator americanus TaxID=51031 RepID=A0ABR1EMQ1_NECAM
MYNHLIEDINRTATAAVRTPAVFDSSFEMDTGVRRGSDDGEAHYDTFNRYMFWQGMIRGTLGNLRKPLYCPSE